MQIIEGKFKRSPQASGLRSAQHTQRMAVARCKCAHGNDIRWNREIQRMADKLRFIRPRFQIRCVFAPVRYRNRRVVRPPAGQGSVQEKRQAVRANCGKDARSSCLIDHREASCGMNEEDLNPGHACGRPDLRCCSGLSFTNRPRHQSTRHWPLADSRSLRVQPRSSSPERQ